jgi:broad-specificity NMP kinase
MQPQPSGRPQLVELAGPAGVGKSTVARVLRDRTTVHPANIWGLPVLPLLGNGLQLLPTLLGFWRRSHSLLWDESRHLVRLQTLQKSLKAGAAPAVTMLLFDEGPIFSLAWLRGFGHESMRSDAADDWWRNTFGQWARVVDVVVVLEAPDHLLAQRIRGREHWHEVKHLSDREIAVWMARFRGALNWVLAGLAAAGGPVIVRVTTEADQPEHVAELVLTALQRVSRDN